LCICDFLRIFARQMHRKYYILFLLIVCVITACTPRSIREAQSIVAQADSLRAKGCMYSDSAELAQAYETLGQWQWFYADEYAHACYHYGRILREKEHPVEAMQVFINAIHAGSDDKQILGRIYNNMGDICHRANEFDLSYDMFERSANIFLSDKDTLSYYYCLNDMAFELAEQGQKEETLTLVLQIEKGCDDVDVIAHVLGTRAELYLKCKQYDSLLFFAKEAQSFENPPFISYVQMAQAYSFLTQKDSATRYAKYILEHTDDISAVNNALYILTADDQTKDIDEVREAAADRSDTQKLIEINRSKHAQAVQLLEPDLNRKLSWTWLYAIMGTLAIVGASIWIYVHRKRLQHQLLSQQVNELTSKKIAAQQCHEQLVHEYTEYTNNLVNQVEQNCAIFFQNEKFPDNIYWKDFVAMCKLINDNFGMLVSKLQSIYQLSEKEIRLCILVLIGNPGSKQMADWLCYSESGIRNYKNRIAKKLGTNSTQLRDFLIDLTTNRLSK